MYARAGEAREAGEDFDLDAEIKALAETGYVFPLPIVSRVLSFADLVKAIGWQGAAELSAETFEGWEVDFLGTAFGILSRAERGQELLEQYRLWAVVLGGRGG